jgi:hypothetical protein
MGLVSFTAKDARESGAEVVRDEADPFHVLLHGNKNKFPKLLAEKAKLVRAPSA